MTKKNKAQGNQTKDKQEETADVPEGGVKIVEGENIEEDEEAPSRVKKGKYTNRGTEEDTMNVEEETQDGKGEEEIKTEEAEEDINLEFFNFEDFEVVDELEDEEEEKEKNEVEDRDKNRSSSQRQKGQSNHQYQSSHSGHSRDRVRDRYDDKERNGSSSRSSRTSSRHYDSSRKHERRDDHTSGDKHRERRKETEKDRTQTRKRPREDEVKSSKKTKTTDHKETSRKETTTNIGARVVLKRMKQIKTNVQDEKNMEISIQSNTDDQKTGVNTRTRSSARNTSLPSPQRITRSQKKVDETPPVCKGKKETSSKAVKKTQEQVNQIETNKESNQVKEEIKSESVCEESQFCDASKSAGSEVISEDDVISITVNELDDVTSDISDSDYKEEDKKMYKESPKVVTDTKEKVKETWTMDEVIKECESNEVVQTTTDRRSTSPILTLDDITSPASSPGKHSNEDLDSVSSGILSVSPGHSSINSPEDFVDSSSEEPSLEDPPKLQSKGAPLLPTPSSTKQSSQKGFPENKKNVALPNPSSGKQSSQKRFPENTKNVVLPTPPWKQSSWKGFPENTKNVALHTPPWKQSSWKGFPENTKNVPTIVTRPPPLMSLLNLGIMVNPVSQQINYLPPVNIHQTGHTYPTPNVQVGWDRNIDTDISRNREKQPMVRGRSKSRSLSPKRMDFTRSRSGSQDRLLISQERKAMHRWSPRKSPSPLQGYRLFPEGTSFQHGRRSTSRSKRSYSRDWRSVSRGRRSFSRGRSLSKGRNLERRSVSRGRRSVSIGRSIPRNRSISRGRRSLSRERRSISRGRRSISRGRRSISRGRRSISRGRRSISRGRRSISRGRRSLSRGRSISRGRRSISRGRRSISRGRRSISRGRRSISRGRRSISRGRRSISRERRSLSRGRRSTSRSKRSPFHASSIQQKRKEFKEEEALKTLRLLHDKECEKYRSNPTIHPDLGVEYRRFCEQKTQSILALGGDPSQYNMAEAWHSFWIKRIEEIFLEQWKAKKNQCLAMLDTYKNQISIQPSVRSHRSSSVIYSSDMSISEDSEESEPRRSKVRKRKKKSSPVKSTKIKTSDKRDREIESPVNTQLPETGVRKENDYILTNFPDMIREVRQVENNQSSMIREVRQEEWEQHLSRSQEMTQTIKDAWEPKPEQQDVQSRAMSRWDESKRSDPHGIEEDKWLISSKKSVLKSSKSPQTTVQEPPLKERSWHQLDSKLKEMAQSTNIDDRHTSGISEIFKSFAMKPSQTRELDSNYKRNPTEDKPQDKPMVKDYHHRSEGITQMFQKFAAKIGDKSAIPERTRDTSKSLPSTLMLKNYPTKTSDSAPNPESSRDTSKSLPSTQMLKTYATKTSDTAPKPEGSMDSSKSLSSTQMFKSYGTMTSDTVPKPEQNKDTSKSLPPPMASKENTKIDVVNVLEVLIHLGDKLGALCDPLKVVLERTKKLQSNGADPMDITNDQDSKLLLRMVREKLQGILKDDKLNIIKKVIIQEAEQRLSLLLDLHEERSLTGNLSLTQLARHCLSMDDSATMDFIRTVLKCQGHADVSEQQLMKLYVTVKEEQLKLLRDRHNKGVANTSLSSTDNLHHQKQNIPYPPLISKVIGDSVTSLESKSASLLPMSQTESQSSTSLYNSQVSRIMELSRNQAQATHNNSDLDPGRQWETPSYSQVTVTDGSYRSNWPGTINPSMVFQPGQHSVLSNWSLESQNTVSHPKASTSSLSDSAQNMLRLSQKASKYVRKKPICMTLPKQQPQKTIMGTYNPLGDYDTDNEGME